MDASLRPLTDRRVSIRTCALAELGIRQARVRPGHEASVIDISAHGALIETALRLLPGRHIELQIERGDQLTPIRGRVVRCRVARVHASRVSYEGAIGFDQPLGWLVATANHHEYPVLAALAVDRSGR
jgi:PilZ domain-containing protein